MNGGGVLLENGAAFQEVDADAVIEEDGGIGGVVFDAGAGLDEADDDEEGVARVDFSWVRSVFSVVAEAA